MANKNTDSALRARVDAFVADLSDIIRQAALESVREALGDVSGPPSPRRGRGPGRPKGSGRKAGKRGGRIRRSSEDLEKLSGSFLTYVRGNPGQRLEEIGAGMRVATKELKRPVQQLLAAKSIRTEGQRRGTKYFAGGGRGGGKKRGRRKKA